jgi:hypothetical protein
VEVECRRWKWWGSAGLKRPAKMTMTDCLWVDWKKTKLDFIHFLGCELSLP